LEVATEGRLKVPRGVDGESVGGQLLPPTLFLALRVDRLGCREAVVDLFEEGPGCRVHEPESDPQSGRMEMVVVMDPDDLPSKGEGDRCFEISEITVLGWIALTRNVGAFFRND
jgi:hypothetical protein